MSNNQTNLEDLPTELCLIILQHFDAIASHEPQSIAFKRPEKERARQRENYLRTRTLASLSRVSRKMRAIATPILYASFTSLAIFQDFDALRLFHRTLTSLQNATGFPSRHCDFLLCLENRLADLSGHSLVDIAEEDGAPQMIARYFYMLGDVAKQAKNLQHLNIVSVETDEVSFWKHFTGWKATDYNKPDASRSPVKLHNLYFQIHNEVGEIDSGSLFRRISETMSPASLLNIHASGLPESDGKPLASHAFSNVQRLELTSMMLQLEATNAILLDCRQLKHLTCKWTYLICDQGANNQPSDIYTGLCQHATSLETLHIDMRDCRFSDDMTTLVLEKVGSLINFTALKSLTICTPSLFGANEPPSEALEYVLNDRLSTLLPHALQSLTLLFLETPTVPWASASDYNLDQTLCDWELVDDCKQNLTELEEFNVYGCMEETGQIKTDFHAPKTLEPLRELGIQCNMTEEPQVSFHRTPSRDLRTI